MRTKAVENAKARALALTKPLNQNIGTAIHITDAENSNQLQGTVTGIYIRGKSSFRSGDVDLPKIEFEKIQITMTVNVAFILK